MNLLSNLQFSLYNIFELYKTQGKRYYGFSMLFAIFSSLFSTIFITLFFLFLQVLYTAYNSGPSFSFMELIERAFMNYNLSEYVLFMMIFNVGLYGLFLHRQQQHPTDQKITLRHFFGSIGAETWVVYFSLIIGGILTSLLISYLTYSGNRHDSGEFHGSAGFMTHSMSLIQWLRSIVRLLQDILPVLLVFIMMYRNLSKKGLLLSKKETRSAFFSLLLIAFTISELSDTVITFVRRYISILIEMPFMEPLIPSILMMVVYIFLIAVFYLGLAGAMIFPFLYKQEQPAESTPLTDEP